MIRSEWTELLRCERCGSELRHYQEICDNCGDFLPNKVVWVTRKVLVRGSCWYKPWIRDKYRLEEKKTGFSWVDKRRLNKVT